MNLDLGTSNISTISYGTTTWNALAANALAVWNQTGVGIGQDHNFFSVKNPAVVGDACSRDGVNEVRWATTICGLSFGSALAVTQGWILSGKRVEEDVLFNSTYNWDAYSGPLRTTATGQRLVDFYRVALHEFGHAAGLDHPDEAGQTVQALMNSQISNLDSLQADDIAGAHAIAWPPGVGVLAPDLLSFTKQTGIALNTQVTSNTVTVTAHNSPAPISVTGGEYSINGGPFTSASETVSNGQTVTLRVTSSGSYLTATTAVLMIESTRSEFTAITTAGPAPITVNTFGYYPLADGNSWAYQKNGIGTYTITILPGVTAINGVNTKVAQDSDGKLAYYTNDNNGIRQHGSYDPNYPSETDTIIPPYVYAQSLATIGQSVSNAGTINTVIPQLGINTNLSYTGTSTPEGFEIVTVPAGTYNTIRVYATLSFSGVINGQSVSGTSTDALWVAEGIGVVKEISVSSSGTKLYLLTGTTIPDTTPDPFTFTAQTGVPVSTVVVSNFVTISGINAPASISITGGEYSIDGGPFTSAPGTISSNGHTVYVRLTSSSSISTTTAATLTVGGVSATFSVTTTAFDTMPDAFSFIAVTGVLPSTLVTSNAITISGINTAVSISVSGGEYSVDGGAFTSASGTVSNGQTITVRQISPSNLGNVGTTFLTVGSVTVPFRVTTQAPPGMPVLYFQSQPGDYIGGGQERSFSAETLFNFQAFWGNGVSFSISSYGNVDYYGGGEFWSLRMAAPNGAAPVPGSYEGAVRTYTATQAGLDFFGAGRGCNTTTGRFDVFEAVYDGLGGVVSFASNFEQHCEGGTPALFGQIRYNSAVPLGSTAVAPAPFSFASQTGAPRSTPIVSNPVTVTGFSGTALIRISGGEYSVNGAPYTAAIGAITAGQTVTVRVISSSAYSTSTSATLTVGARSATFSVTTLAAPTLSSLLINGPTVVPESGSGSYSATAVWSDGTFTAVTPAWSSSNPSIAAIDAGGNVTAGAVAQDTAVRLTATYTAGSESAAGSFTLTVADSASTLTPQARAVEPGFNLLGNGLNGTINVLSTFGGPGNPVAGVTENVVSVWKWNALLQRWGFYSPLLTGEQNAAYAVSQGYELLTSIQPGEGFWVNTPGPVTLPLQAGSPASFAFFNFDALLPGFNLIAISPELTPTEFNNTVAQAVPLAQGAPMTANFTSLWMWDAVVQKWYFYSPILEASGGLAAVKSYADSQGFLHFQDFGKKLGGGAGFWVNK